MDSKLSPDTARTYVRCLASSYRPTTGDGRQDPKAMVIDHDARLRISPHEAPLAVRLPEPSPQPPWSSVEAVLRLRSVEHFPNAAGQHVADLFPCSRRLSNQWMSRWRTRS